MLTLSNNVLTNNLYPFAAAAAAAAAIKIHCSPWTLNGLQKLHYKRPSPITKTHD